MEIDCEDRVKAIRLECCNVDIYIIRHADALPLGANGIQCDEDRPLSEAGCKQATVLGKALKKHGISLDLIVTSPLVRSVQTAAHLRKEFQLSEQQVETRDELAPDGRAKKLARYLNGLSANTVALVGHQPDLGMYAGWLIGDKDSAIQFAKSGIALIRVEGSAAKGSGVLLWLLTPEWLE
jgi:phosphohistidine phosphatase